MTNKNTPKHRLISLFLILILILPTILSLTILASADTSIQYKLELLWVSEDHETDVYGLDWSPNGRYIVIGTDNGWLKVYDAESGEYLWGLELGGEIMAVDWSPDGKYIAATNWDGEKVFVIDASTHKIVWSKKLDSWTRGIAWDPSGQYLAVGTGYYLYLFNKNGEQLWLERQPIAWIDHIAWSHSGDKIAFGGGVGGESAVVYSRDGRKLWEHTTGVDVSSVDWSPDDQYLAVGSADHHVYVFDRNGNLLWSRDMGANVFNVAWDPSGEYLAVSGSFGTALFTRNGEQLWIHNDIYSCWSPYAHGNLEWNKHGILVIGSYKLFILDKNGNILAESEQLGGDTGRVVWSPDQTRIAAVGDYGKLYVWSIKAEAGVNQSHGGQVPVVPVIPGGTLLFVASGLGIIGLAGMLYILRRKRNITDEENITVPRTSVDNTNKASVSPNRGISRDTGFSVEVVRKYLTEKIPGLTTGYSCSGEWHSVKLVSGLVPSEYTGQWLCCKLGCGGWGCSYLCRRKNENIVVKIPHGFEAIIEGGAPPSVHIKLLENIHKTADIIMKLKHPNILRLLGVGKQAPVLVYEYADQGTLEWQLANGWIPTRRDTLRLILQLADALRYIHGRGLVHGDVKPANIFFVDGVAKIGDFSGLRKLLSLTSSKSRITNAYTIGFRAPEQVYSDMRRKVKEMGLEHMIDIYGLGNTILYMLTGRSVDGEEAVEPGTIQQAVDRIEDPEIRKLVEKMLEPEPWNRPTAMDIVRTVLKLLASEKQE